MSALQPSKTLCLILVAASAAVTLSACGSTRQPQTYKNRDLGDAANANVNLLALRAVSVLTPPDGESYRAGADATLTFTIANQGSAADDLVAIRTTSARSVVLGAGGPAALGTAASALPTASAVPTASALPTASAAPSPKVKGAATLTIPAYGVVNNATALLGGLTESLRAGNYITVTFVFRDNGSKDVDVPVEVGNSPAPRTTATHNEAPAPE